MLIGKEIRKEGDRNKEGTERKKTSAIGMGRLII